MLALNNLALLWLSQRSGAPFGDSVIFVLAGSFKSSWLGYITYCLVARLGDFVRIWACDVSEALYGNPVAL